MYCYDKYRKIKSLTAEVAKILRKERKRTN